MGLKVDDSKRDKHWNDERQVADKWVDEWLGEGTTVLANLPVYETSDSEPQWYDLHTLRESIIGDFPAFELLDHLGRRFNNDSMCGRIVVANFIFTGSVTLAPQLMAVMTQLQQALRDVPEVMLLSHSVSPQLDAPVMLQAYAESHRLDGEQWRLLTGAESQMEAVLQQGYLLPEPTSIGQRYWHTDRFVLLDGWQRVRGNYQGTSATDMQRLLQDIRSLRSEI